LGAKEIRTLKTLQFSEGTGSKNDVTVTIFDLVSNSLYFLSLNDMALVYESKKNFKII
jgi:hypothetical protein